jgi:L-malate glycosyltransferase
LLFPSRREAEVLGLVAIEALACGVPVIGSRMAAIPEYVIDGQTGYLCEPGSVAEFALRTAGVLDADRARWQCAEIAARYDARVVAAELAREILRLMGGRKS